MSPEIPTRPLRLLVNDLFGYPLDAVFKELAQAAHLQLLTASTNEQVKFWEKTERDLIRIQKRARRQAGHV